MLKTKSILLLAVLLFCSGLLPVMADEIPEAPPQSQIVRVCLRSLNLTDRVDLRLTTSYLAEPETGGKVYFPANGKLAVWIQKDQLILGYGEICLVCGRQLSLRRMEEGGFCVGSGKAEYRGDLELGIEDGKLLPVLSIHVEEYLLGVVPYEMGESSPLEALKAQAVAARTYALRRPNAHEKYDVSDTSADQNFRGYVKGNGRSEQAVRETRGVCGYDRGQLAQCYYAASNGGQTELVRNVWPDREDLSYYDQRPDPYDVEHPLSIVRRYEIKKTYDHNAPSGLIKLVASALDMPEENLDILRVDEVKPELPLREGSLVMTKLRLKLRLATREKAEDEFVALSEPMLLDIDIFPDAEKALSMNITPGYDNELWTVVDQADAFVLEARRFGHGVGMSQRGAQWMALTYEKSYLEILSFYYPGMELMRLPEEPVTYATDEILTASRPPEATPTPKPTVMPILATPKAGQQWAEVTGISNDSSLNLRAEPSPDANIIMRLLKGQRMLVVENREGEEWVKVEINDLQGYVMKKFITIEP